MQDHRKNKARDGKGNTITPIWPVDVRAPEGSLYPRVGQWHSNEQKELNSKQRNGKNRPQQST